MIVEPFFVDIVPTVVSTKLVSLEKLNQLVNNHNHGLKKVGDPMGVTDFYSKINWLFR
jgi:hypothetical protein